MKIHWFWQKIVHNLRTKNWALREKSTSLLTIPPIICYIFAQLTFNDKKATLMKKLAPLFLASFLLANTCFADTAAPATTATAATATPADDHGNEITVINSNLSAIPQSQHEENQEAHYTIDMKYPQISGKELSVSAQKFNQQVTDLVNQEIVRFKKFVKEDTVHMQTLPEDMKHNTLSVDYDIDVIHSSKQPIISVRLAIEGMQAGRAHPYHSYRTLNFDLGTGKVLALNDIFKPKTNYLKIFAKYSNQKLNNTLKDKFMISNGTAPDIKNYKTWNIEPDGILITFDEYQVAPYVDGAQEVEIPFSELKNVIATRSPVIKS